MLDFSKKESIECISACLSCVRLIIKKEIDDEDNITSIEKETRLILYVPNNNDDLEKYKNIIPSFKHVPKNNINNKLPTTTITRHINYNPIRHISYTSIKYINYSPVLENI